LQSFDLVFVVVVVVVVDDAVVVVLVVKPYAFFSFEVQDMVFHFACFVVT